MWGPLACAARAPGFLSTLGQPSPRHARREPPFLPTRRGANTPFLSTRVPATRGASLPSFARGDPWHARREPPLSVHAPQHEPPGS
ncbi:unnamed protein product [Rangifer tarandus platyrhynchus]|uniref:Secreted protein n=1 Tax=Rangifer tarandus platyrhynchus TaxID=3082113 RepID=A0ABN9A578_RANTA|nr:unnamed protein product [Rangifer tarandus platyrhynchus]